VKDRNATSLHADRIPQMRASQRILGYLAALSESFCRGLSGEAARTHRITGVTREDNDNIQLGQPIPWAGSDGNQNSFRSTHFDIGLAFCTKYVCVCSS